MSFCSALKVGLKTFLLHIDSMWCITIKYLTRRLKHTLINKGWIFGIGSLMHKKLDKIASHNVQHVA